MSLIPILFLASGLLILALSIPLIRRTIPMNHYYGFRVQAAFSSKDRWYAINEYSGRVLAKWSVLSIGAGLAGFFLPSEWFVEYASAATFLLVCSAAIPLVLTFRWIRKTYGVQQDAAPNGGPVASVRNARLTKGPPSVS
jgi:hypothetical protein